MINTDETEVVIQQILTEEDIVLLKQCVLLELENRENINYQNANPFPDGIDSSLYTRYHEECGRRIIEFFNIPEQIILKLQDVINKNFDSYHYIGSTFCEYSLDFGKPNLVNHYDSLRKDHICMDYQIESNIDWTLTVRDKKYPLKDNDALCFFPVRHIHGRVEKEFKDNDFVNMFFFYFGKDKNDTWV